MSRLFGICSCTLLVVVTACAASSKVSIAIPAHAKLDASPFHRVLVAGFIVNANAALDTNAETVRLLRSQLRSKTSLAVVDTDTLPLDLIAHRYDEIERTANNSHDYECSRPLKHEDDALACQFLFADTGFWRRIGEEYGEPLIVTGTVVFTSFPRVQLKPRFVFIDGRTGTVMHSETVHREIRYVRRRPPLASYFLLMDRAVPDFLRVLTDHPTLGTRILLR